VKVTLFVVTTFYLNKRLHTNTVFYHELFMLTTLQWDLYRNTDSDKSCNSISTTKYFSLGRY